MKIRIEIQTTESSPDIAALVAEVIKHAVEKHGSGDDVRVLEDDGLLNRIETAQTRIEAADVTRGTMQYQTKESGPEHSLTFTLETTP